MVPIADLGPDPGGGGLNSESVITPHGQAACLAVANTSAVRSSELVTTDKKTMQILIASDVDNSHESDTVPT